MSVYSCAAIYLSEVVDLFRVDADGVHTVDWSREGNQVVVRDRASKVAVYVASTDASLKSSVESERKSLIEAESALQFDPARSDADFEQLKSLAGTKGAEP